MSQPLLKVTDGQKFFRRLGAEQRSADRRRGEIHALLGKTERENPRC